MHGYFCVPVYVVPDSLLAWPLYLMSAAIIQAIKLSPLAPEPEFFSCYNRKLLKLSR